MVRMEKYDFYQILSSLPSTGSEKNQTTTVKTACQARLWIKNFQNTSHRVTVAEYKENGWQAFLRLNPRALKGKITTYTIINFIVTHAHPRKENKRKNTERITDHTLILKNCIFSTAI